MEEQVNQTSQNNLHTAKQEFIDETESATNILELYRQTLAIIYNGRQYQTAHHIQASTKMQTCKRIN